MGLRNGERGIGELFCLRLSAVLSRYNPNREPRSAVNNVVVCATKDRAKYAVNIPDDAC